MLSSERIALSKDLIIARIPVYFILSVIFYVEFSRVATIVIPVQQFESEAQMRLAEQISYTPWHTLPAHEPLGGINRTRRVVYEAVSRVRHELNGTVREEPVSLEVDI
jgi:hypothetical protein